MSYSVQLRAPRAPAKRSSVIYDGPSLLDGMPIIVVASVESKNSKTGGMVQTTIIRKDIDPRVANKTGQDVSICGHCESKGKVTTDPDKALAEERPCYVVIAQGPLNSWKTATRGNYAIATEDDEIAELGRGEKVRLGTYGDPGAVPQRVWDAILKHSAGWTAYTHQAKHPRANFNPEIMMVSVDSEAEAREQWAQGNRTFRVLRKGEAKIPGMEIDCPHPTHGVQCEDCMLCGGKKVKAKSIVIDPHGAGKKWIG